MPETAVSGWDIMLRAAEEMGKLKACRITAVGGTPTTMVECGSQAAVTMNTYKYGLARVHRLGSVVQVSAQGDAYTTPAAAGGKFTLAPALSGAAVAGEVLELAFWNENEYGAILAAVREAINASFPYWYRDVRLDLNHSTISDGTTFTMLVFDQTTDEYALPTDCARLTAIGTQVDTSHEMTPISRQDLWDVIGQEGALKLKFTRGAAGNYLPTDYHGKTICLHYMAREPALNTSISTATCQIPLDLIGKVTANVYKRRHLFLDSRGELAPDQVGIPQLQAAAAEAWGSVEYVKPRQPMGLRFVTH